MTYLEVLDITGFQVKNNYKIYTLPNNALNISK